MAALRRIQLRRTKGWRLPEGAVSVARPTRWGNPFRIGDPEIPDRRAAVAAFRAYLAAHPELVEAARRELRGKVLACWCAPGTPCHGDVLLEIANR